MSSREIMAVTVLALAMAAPALGQTAPQDPPQIAETGHEAAMARLAALDELRRTDIDAYVEALADLVSDGDELLAAEATNRLVNIVTMMGMHSGGDHSHHDMSIVDRVVAVLRPLVVHPNAAVRDAAAIYLIGRDDPEALSSVTEAAASGRIPDEEALTYFMVGRTEDAMAEVRRYAESEDTTQAARAVEYLSADTEQQTYVRDAILTNTEVDLEVRATALESLSIYDERFSTYATDPAVVDLALEVEQLPGDLSMTGVDALTRPLQLEILTNPGLTQFYADELNQTVLRLRELGEFDKAIRLDQELIQKIE